MARRAFTIVELLVVLAIISVLVGLLVVAVGGARTTARSSTTKARMGAMVQAVARFEGDTGYLPALLDNDRSALDGLEPTWRAGTSGPAYLRRMQGWYSYTSPAEYLLGYGSEEQDGHDGLGLRRPGEDGYWNALAQDALGDADGIGTLFERTPPQGTTSALFSNARGAVLGPYLEIDDASMVGAIGGDIDGWDGTVDPATGQPRIYMAGDADFNAYAPKVILDAWGTPIRYYRVNHPSGNPGGRFGAGYVPAGHESDGWTYTPSLSEFVALRPFTVDPNEAVTWTFHDADGAAWGDFQNVGAGTAGDPFGDPTTTGALNTGRFAFFSSGADRHVFPWARVDNPGEADGRMQWLGDHRERAPQNWSDDGFSAVVADGAYPTVDSEETNIDNLVEIGR